ncbi:LANO_0E13696g1_1 [Lachancea nothofagi CBS 11611]|uniref:LANO_0E13696g1_1 n=1 Tax=Lachancea nothofagi CBS 11611 TaxID=1266666 RepID=A0A1G4JZ60_9SACH|nr:LANO_0E13696g1_1 [Lachancea nothofagi CBS 11611]
MAHVCTSTVVCTRYGCLPTCRSVAWKTISALTGDWCRKTSPSPFARFSAPAPGFNGPTTLPINELAIALSTSGIASICDLPGFRRHNNTCLYRTLRPSPACLRLPKHYFDTPSTHLRHLRHHLRHTFSSFCLSSIAHSRAFLFFEKGSTAQNLCYEVCFFSNTEIPPAEKMVYYWEKCGI